MEENKLCVRTKFCDFCNQETAVLYCRADTAKLCITCDQHVHSANTLSKKHQRFPLCDTCGSEYASVKYITRNLFICQDCNSDLINNVGFSSDDQTSVECFSGCPSSSELSVVLGLDLAFDMMMMIGYGYDLRVPANHNVDPTSPLGYDNDDCGVLIEKCFDGKKQAVIKQLLNLQKKEKGFDCGNAGEIDSLLVPHNDGFLIGLDDNLNTNCNIINDDFNQCQSILFQQQQQKELNFPYNYNSNITRNVGGLPATATNPTKQVSLYYF